MIDRDAVKRSAPKNAEYERVEVDARMVTECAIKQYGLDERRTFEHPAQALLAVNG
jgi:hypothetical protein